LAEAFDEAFNLSEILILETDLNPEDIKKIRSKLLAYTVHQNNKSLKTEFCKDVYTRLDSAFIASGLSLDKLTVFKPVMAVLSLTAAELHKIGVSRKGVDRYFYEMTKRKDKKIDFFEEPEFQIKLISELGEGSENEYVLHSIVELRYYHNFYIKSFDDWKKGDTIDLSEMNFEYKKSFSKLYDDLFLTRNNN
jgi:uncharacterized protein YbaP (TraB family)